LKIFISLRCPAALDETFACLHSISDLAKSSSCYRVQFWFMSELEKASATKKIAVSAGVIAGNKLAGMTPQYPAIAKMQRIQGTVAIRIVISTAGVVTDAALASGNAELGEAAIEALRTWRIRPILVDGATVEAESTLRFEFTPDEPVRMIV
jgi:TonB family protein